MISSSQWTSTSRNFLEKNHKYLNRKKNNRQIVKISHSVEECRREWELIEEATKILTRNNFGLSSLPPIYPEDSSPWDVNYQVHTDDDEWLIEGLSEGWDNSLELEEILHADQVINRILKTSQWSIEENIMHDAPSMSEICRSIDTISLMKVHEEIKDSVLIKKGRSSYNDPTGTKSYSFDLNASKFPALQILREKEEHIMAEIDSILQNLVSSKRYKSKLAGDGEKYEVDGRIVLTTTSSKGIVGIPRGKSDFGTLIYVEPKEIVHLGDELSSIRDEMTIVQNQVLHHLSRKILQEVSKIDKGLNVVAKIDCIFARAIFGSVMNGYIPYVGTEGGTIQVRDFVHPILTVNKHSNKDPVPIDLFISTQRNENSLIISGPNAGGKTLAMKSFGLVAIMNRMGIPIPIDKSIRKNEVENLRVDFFKNIFVKIGDDQNVMHGESTYMAQLHVLSKIVEKVSLPLPSSTNTVDYSLILLDELGDGTDPEAGGCIAQAVLEKLVENNFSRTVSTTHSPRLKALSLSDDRFTAASVLLGRKNSTKSRYELSYGTIGQSHALHAASRITPEFPNDLLVRAESLMSSGNAMNGEQIRKISEALEKERERAHDTKEEAMEIKKQMIDCRDSMIRVAKAYEQDLSRLEGRLSFMLETLNNDENKDAYDVIGSSIATLRLVKKRVKSKEELLKEKGLKILSEYTVLKGGESVIIVNGGNFDGETATVSFDQGEASYDEVIVELHCEELLNLCPTSSKESILLKRKDIAVWDYPDDDDDWHSDDDFRNYGSLQDERNRLFDKIKSLKSTDKEGGSLPKSKQVTEKKFISSRERKAASRMTKKEKKKKR